MASTQHPLIWDFYRTVVGAEELGGVVHYWDEMSQSIWLNDGMQTAAIKIPEGHWGEAQIEDIVDIGTPAYDALSLDHPYNGVLFGAAMLGNDLYYLRHVYAMDCSDILDSGQLGFSNNNAVSQLKVNVMNIKQSIFMNEDTVFQPGARVIFGLLAGEEAPMTMCESYLDSMDYNVSSATVPISGRNNIGFKLMQSTFDADMTLSGMPHEVAQTICEMAGIAELIIQSVSESRDYEFRAEQTLMAGLEQICSFYPGWKVDELPSGTIIMGPPTFINNYQGNDYYVFEEGNVFKRRTKRSCDASYTKVRITGKDSEGNDLEPVIAPVNCYEQWGLPPNKTYHEKMPDGYTQEDLQAYAESVAELLQYVGIGEDFSSSFQPQLAIGDIAAIDNGDGTMALLGIVTSIKHKFGKSGFATEFSVDSGGVVTEVSGTNGEIVTTTKPLNGYNRKQNLKDLIQVASGSSAAGPQATGNVTKVVSSSNASTLEGKTLTQVINMAVAAVPKELPEYGEGDYDKFLSPSEQGVAWKNVPNELPTYTASDYGKVLSPDASGLKWVEQSGGGGSYVVPNMVNYTYQYSTGSTTHSRTYTGNPGNKLLLLVLTRGELTTVLEGWTQVGILEESGDKTAGRATYVQYVYAFEKICEGNESIEYAQEESNMSMTCIMEFSGVSGFEVLEFTRQENVASSSACFTGRRTSTRMSIWVGNSLYWLSGVFAWIKSDTNVWELSANQGYQPRLGVMLDNRVAPVDFTFGLNMSDASMSAFCIQVVPAQTT